MVTDRLGMTYLNLNRDSRFYVLFCANDRVFSRPDAFGLQCLFLFTTTWGIASFVDKLVSPDPSGFTTAPYSLEQTRELIVTGSAGVHGIAIDPSQEREFCAVAKNDFLDALEVAIAEGL